MSKNEIPEVAFLFSLIGGGMMLAGGFLMFAWTPYVGWRWGMMYPGMMGWFWGSMGFVWGFALVSIVSGIIIISSLMLRARPAEHTSWGALIVIFSLLSLLGMGGFFIGALLGLIGGALAMSWKSAQR